ncbi:DUF3899 domain-containing protein [Sporosarcina sp. G11-34]|uniref:DUF3899 domain-containing protein n=1 Tax=Sporosarcina sp. G11-34 TaxID=2849605 RepID=UPI0022A8EC2E|nr:DUF3899 domain-containing protein [Sporosarcina sp. G11-34]MCZ2259093.1 DUF3899 domain-containing protein [Sporosarcina sp. G11-34]
MHRYLLINLLVAPLVLFIFTAVFFSTRIVTSLDFVFYVGLLLLLVGSVMLVLQAGFFNAFISTSKHFFSTISRKEQAIQNFEGKKGEAAVYKKEYPILNTFLVVGGVYCLFSIIGSIAVVYLNF